MNILLKMRNYLGSIWAAGILGFVIGIVFLPTLQMMLDAINDVIGETMLIDLRPLVSADVMIPQDGRLHFGIDVPGGLYTITAVGLGDELDPEILLFESGGEFVEGDDDGGGGYNSRLTTNLKDGRTYVLVVEELGGYSGMIQVMIFPDQ